MQEAMDAWCSQMMKTVVHEDMLYNPSIDFMMADIVVPTCIRYGKFIVDWSVEPVPAKKIAERDSSLSQSRGYLVMDLIAAGALGKLSVCMGNNFWVHADLDDDFLSVRYAKFASPNPEDDTTMRIAYARTRMTLRAVYYADGVPEFLRINDAARCPM